MSTPGTSLTLRPAPSRGKCCAEPDYLSTESNSEPNRGSITNFTVEPYIATSPLETPQLEDLSLRDPVTPGKPRERHFPRQHQRVQQQQQPQQQQEQQPQQPSKQISLLPRPQPKVFTPNYDEGTQRVFAGAQKHSAYDFDSAVVSMSMVDAPKSANDEMPVNTLTLQPETRQISEDQLINEVRTIYAGLVLVEKKCVEIDRQQAKNPASLSNEQWQALIALHRTLLHEHHDFFLASQHPAASPALQKLASRYAMPARMWRHGIHSFLELLRHRLPEALDHMLAFIYTAYSMMALLLESVPSFEDTWIECLGDLARYRMAVEEADLRDREVWAGVARYWYNKAADKSPQVGRIQHHLAVLARPNILQQLFFYSKSLICVQPFPNAKESVLLLFNPLLESKEPTHHSPVMSSFVKAHGILFGKRSILAFLEYGLEFISYLKTQIGRTGSKWREQGVYIACANFASLLEYGADSVFMKLIQDAIDSPISIVNAKDDYHSASSALSLRPLSSLIPPASDGTAKFENSNEIISYATCFTFQVFTFVLKHIGDKNVLPHAHVSLAFLWSLSRVPKAMAYIQSEIPWQAVATFLNTLNTQGLNESRLRNETFPVPEIGMQRHLPEDFAMRGSIWCQLYYPLGFFDVSSLEDDDERFLEPPSVTVPRSERCLWLGHRLASMDRWITYDENRKEFVAKDISLELQNISRCTKLFEEAASFFDHRDEAQTPTQLQDALGSEDLDIKMSDAEPVQAVEPEFRSPEVT
ncbi:hypothetical protein LOZ12_006427 [Ophidiomyces ophidiicola]|uniref:Uncharacterized protein n=1 Tax=Ophidiomyces ophidiicola TaxID=1387563 RepID=A0ACB8UPP5_9EURO|nr:hypothetical protein LOZ64_006514 [Ophidiomyces ophidiicola]KAI1935851.1 hypothetical protein LOZ62_005853 [Ophidiomyces ophidiicola]KAI1963822.1 hypothetical protein LOZ56_006311 [Ophidiomyces ophidiicola]KAI2007973.1 hypothetical protein LOZ50_002206 [Ophidiomyces ophidiicola]KAI2008110.1 hypothetical protein LOZ46_006681 [Ophidiomyces ophidiicola]